jgi:hypothetical protein
MSEGSGIYMQLEVWIDSRLHLHGSICSHGEIKVETSACVHDRLKRYLTDLGLVPAQVDCNVGQFRCGGLDYWNRANSCMDDELVFGDYPGAKHISFRPYLPAIGEIDRMDVLFQFVDEH